MFMKIMKYKKDKLNTYIVTIDMKDYVLYDDIIVKYELLSKNYVCPSSKTIMLLSSFVS